MPRNAFVALGLAALFAAAPATAQTLSARRMAMGGVIVAGRGPGADAANVAYRAVPAAGTSEASLPLPIGLVPLLQEPPVFDPGDPEFNVFELANLLYNPPFHLQLAGPESPSSDVAISISRNALAVDLGDVREVFPREESRAGGVLASPSLIVGIGPAFVGVAPMVHYENRIELNDALYGALGETQPFVPDTRYELRDRGRAQAAAQAIVGAAARVLRAAAADSSAGLYLGARARVLRGLAYGDADNVAAFSTTDTLFADEPVDLGYTADLRDAGAADGGWGLGMDLGAVWVHGPLELGIGVNDVATRLHWRVRESVATTDSVTGEFVRTTLREDVPFTSDVPVTVVANAALRIGPALIAADVQRSVHDAVLAHAGAEFWTGPLALRAGGGWDANRLAQVSGGVGLRFGRFGLDAAIATHSRNVSRERAVELGVGLGLYR